MLSQDIDSSPAPFEVGETSTAAQLTTPGLYNLPCFQCQRTSINTSSTNPNYGCSALLCWTLLQVQPNHAGPGAHRGCVGQGGSKGSRDSQRHTQPSQGRPRLCSTPASVLIVLLGHGQKQYSLAEHDSVLFVTKCAHGFEDVQLAQDVEHWMVYFCNKHTPYECNALPLGQLFDRDCSSSLKACSVDGCYNSLPVCHTALNL